MNQEVAKQDVRESFLKQHADTLAVLGTLVSLAYLMFSWTDGKFEKIDSRLNSIENRITTIETVMMCNKIMPTHMGKAE